MNGAEIKSTLKSGGKVFGTMLSIGRSPRWVPVLDGVGLDYVLREARTAERQAGVLAALIFKTDMLWAQLDALHHAYVEPGHIPPGAFRPDPD